MLSLLSSSKCPLTSQTEYLLVYTGLLIIVLVCYNYLLSTYYIIYVY